jgi:hypothetical protein
MKPGTPLSDVSTLHACKNGVRRLALTLNSILRLPQSFCSNKAPFVLSVLDGFELMPIILLAKYENQRSSSSESNGLAFLPLCREWLELKLARETGVIRWPQANVRRRRFVGGFVTHNAHFFYLCRQLKRKNHVDALVEC